MNRTNVLRMLPPMASALVAHVYEKNQPVSLVIHRKDHTGMIPVTAQYEDEYDDTFNKLLTDVAQNLNDT